MQGGRGHFLSWTSKSMGFQECFPRFGVAFLGFLKSFLALPLLCSSKSVLHWISGGGAQILNIPILKPYKIRFFYVGAPKESIFLSTIYGLYISHHYTHYKLHFSSWYKPSVGSFSSILSICLCLAPIAGLQLLLDSHKVFCPTGYKPVSLALY